MHRAVKTNGDSVPDAGRDTDKLSVCLVTDSESFLNLKTEWNKLLETRRPVPIALTHEWIYAWWTVFGENRDLHIVCVYDADRLLAIAPFYLERTRYRGLSVTIQRLMVNGSSPFCDIIFDRDCSEQLLEAVLRLINSRTSADILEYSKIPEKSPVVRCLEKNLGSSGTSYGIKPNLNTPVIPIDGQWDDYFASLSRKFRKSMRNSINRFEKSTEFSIRREPVNTSDHHCLDEMLLISKQSWKRQVNNDLGTNIKNRNFIYLLIDQFGPEGKVDLWLMRKAGVPVAFELIFRFDEILYPIRADFSEKFRNISPGSILMFAILKELFIEKQGKQYFSCANDYGYLRNWTKITRRHVDVEIFAGSRKARLLGLLEYKVIPKLRNLRKKFGGKNNHR